MRRWLHLVLGVFACVAVGAKDLLPADIEGLTQEEAIKAQLKEHKAELEEIHPKISREELKLAALYVSEKKYQLAEPLIQSALANRIKAFGPDHREVADAYFTLGEFQKVSNQSAPALESYKQAVVVWTNAFGTHHNKMGLAAYNAAELLRARAKHKEAQEFYETAQARWEADTEKNHYFSEEEKAAVKHVALLKASSYDGVTREQAAAAPAHAHDEL